MFNVGDSVTYEGKRAVIIENRSNVMPVIQFEDGRKFCIAYPEKLKLRKKRGTNGH